MSEAEMKRTRHVDLLVARRLWERLHRPLTNDGSRLEWPEWQQEYERTIAALEPLTDDELRFIVRGRLWAVGTTPGYASLGTTDEDA